MKKTFLNIFLSFVVFSSYAIKKDTVKTTIYSWHLSNDFKLIESLEIDTTINRFQIYNLNFQKSISNTYLGNVGLPSKSNIFFTSDRESPFLFHNFYDNYNYYAKDIEYYYTERPFSNVTYSSGANEEQLLSIIHTQNVNDKFNFGFKYRSVGTDGFYLRQLAKHKAFGSWISYNSLYYKMHLSYTSNKNNLYHNGGIIDDSYITDSINRAENIIVKLNDSKTEMNSRDVFFVQKVNLNSKKEEQINDTVFRTIYEPVLSFGHSFQYGRYYKNYFDNVTNYRNPVISDTIFFDYYLNTFNYSNSFDSVYFREYKNEILFNFHDNKERRIKMGIKAVGGIKIRKYSYFNKDTLFNFSKDTIVNDYYYGIGIYNSVGKKWNWELKTTMSFKGYNEDDMKIIGFAKRSFEWKNASPYILLSGSFNKQKNDYFLNSYSSNHFRWSNNFLTPEKTKIELTFNNPDGNFEVGGNIGFLDNFIYFDTLAMPQQETNTFDIYSAFFQKKFKFWKFNFDNYFVYQKVENDSVLRLPAYTYFGSLYVESILWNWKWMPEEFHDILSYQFGVEVYYHSEYYGYEYMPSIEQFYLQNEKMIGNYPIINVFVNVKISNARIFVKYEHINPGFVDKNPFTTLHYPLSESMLKMGLSWSFYN